MGRTGIMALIIIAILALAGGAYALTWYAGENTASTPPNTPYSSPATANTTTTQQSAANTITYGDNGFSPATLTVKSGDQVTIANNSSHILEFDSDPHPQHTDDPELNVGVVAPGQSKTITVTKPGSHGYHNHANADDTGTIIVQ